MLKQVILALNNLEPDTWTRHEVEDVREFLVSQFNAFPVNARLYHEQVSQITDVTPADENGIEILGELPGPFYVVVYPGDPVTAVFAIVGVLLAVAAYVLSAAPTVAQPPPISLSRNQQQSSPNNELSDRTNRARINGRIPDPFGTVRATPDLIAAPYKIFENNREVEYAYMCVGRGAYAILAASIRDGATKVENIPGTTVMVYGPYTSPNSFDPNAPGIGDPELVVGQLLRIPVLNTKRSNSVNGQVLRPPNAMTFVGLGNVRFRTPNLIELPNGSLEDFTKYFVEGDELTITDATMTAGVDVTQSIVCRATMIAVQQRYPTDGAHHAYDTAGGALIFTADYESVVNGLFVPGGTITLTGGYVGAFGDLGGTYEIDSVHIEGPDNPTETKYAVPTLFIVKLVAPNVVNSNWDHMETSHNQLHFAYNVFFDVVFDGAGAYDLDLNGVYPVVSVTQWQIVLDNPNSVNTDWEDVVLPNVATPFISPTMVASGLKWVGPFVLDDFNCSPGINEVLNNFVAANGIYKDDGVDQIAGEVEIEFEATPIDLDDIALDDPELFRIILKGSSTLKETVAITLKAHFSGFFGRTQIRARRVSETDLDFEGTVVDEVRWRDATSVAPVNELDFGNITTIQSVTYATASALAVKERKLNLIGQRIIPSYDGTSFGAPAGTNDSALILSEVCRDRYIGNRSLAELDITNFFAVAQEVEDYFGTPRVREFNYTFDKDGLSFEETVATIVNAMFCVAYRRGNVIRLSFEKETDDSTILFNHRNKIPHTEKRTINFGQNNDNDGVQYSYVDPADDSINTVFLPQDYASINPKKVESIGVRDHLHAYFHVWRVWNRILYQNTTIEFDATQEADLLVINDRILVSDNTRPNTQDGEVIEVDGTEITLSQLVDLSVSPSYSIFLQLYDGTTQSIAITAGSAANKVILGEAPALPLVIDDDRYAKTTYIIVGSDDVKQTAFLTAEKLPNGRFVSSVKGINYDARYYANDKDFINEVIDENGYGCTGGFTPDNPFAEPDMIAGQFNAFGFIPYGGFNDGAYGATDPYLNGFNIGTLASDFAGNLLAGYQIRSIVNSNNPSDQYFRVALQGVSVAPPDNAFISISYVDSISVTRTYLASAATISTVDSEPFNSDGLVKVWIWPILSTDGYFYDTLSFDFTVT